MRENVKNADTIRMRLANEKSGFQFVTKLPNKTFILGSLLKDNVWMGYIIASWRQLACIDISNGTKNEKTHTRVHKWTWIIRISCDILSGKWTELSIMR